MKKGYIKKILVIMIIFLGCMTIYNEAMAGTWKNGRYYTSSKSYYRNKYVTIEGVLYYFNNAGNSKRYTGIYQNKYYENGKLGTGVYNGKYYKNGVLYTGMVFTGGKIKGNYYTNGVLPSEGKYYKNGVLYTGMLEGKYYKNGSLYTGMLEGKCYKNGVLHTGLYGSTYYQNGKLGTGLYAGKYYQKGKLGTGVYNGKYYRNGVLYTGLYAGKYYQKGKLGTGVYNGKYYEKGSLATGIYNNQGYKKGKLITNKFETINDITYYFNQSGKCITDIEEIVWLKLRTAGFSEYATAGVMGNILKESEFELYNLNKSQSLSKYTGETYTAAVDKGTYSREKFITDGNNKNQGAEYGLCNWSSKTEKGGLYDFAKSRGTSIGNIEIQVEYLIGQLTKEGGADDFAQYSLIDKGKNYTADKWKNAESAKNAAKIFSVIFFKESTELNVEGREKMAKKYYERFRERDELGFFAETTKDNRLKGYWTSTKGRVFKVLDQTKINDFYGEGWHWGDKCNRAAMAIIASGYSNQDTTSLINTMNDCSENISMCTTEQYWHLYGLKAEHTGKLSKEDCIKKLRTTLKAGGYACIWLKGNPYIGKTGRGYTDGKFGYHWVAVVDYRIKDGKEQIAIADMAGADWYPIDEFQHGVSDSAFITEQ